MTNQQKSYAIRCTTEEQARECEGIRYSLDARTLAYYYGDYSEWEIKETPKSRIFNCVKMGEGQDDYAPIKIVTRKDNECRNCCKVWDDGSFTIYLGRDGQPLIFEPINEKQKEITM